MNNLTFKCVNNNLNIKLIAIGNPYTINLKYKIDDDEELIDYIIGNKITLLENQTLSFIGDKHNINFSKDINNYYKFVIEGKGNVNIFGNINSLTRKNLDQIAPNFNRLFENCTNITDASQLNLPFYKLSKNCYARLFFNCNHLLLAPLLPATKLDLKCYWAMFKKCSVLTLAPLLPATDLASGCYYSMFEDCINLIKAPTLPATKLVTNCYNSMFYNCINLNLIEVGFKKWSVYYATNIWLANVSKNGTFTKIDLLLKNEGNSFIPKNWTIINKHIEEEIITPEPGTSEEPIEEPEEPTLADLVPVYTAGEGLALSLDNVFSLTAEIPTYTAGEGLALSLNNLFSLTASIPTKISDLENDSDFITEHQVFDEYAKIIDIPRKFSELNNDSDFMTHEEALSTFITSSSIPTKVSQLQNDVGCITNAQLKNKIIDLILNNNLFKNYLIKTLTEQPLTFIATDYDYNNSISLIKNGNPLDIILQYNKNNTIWQEYTLGTTFYLRKDETISFRNITSNFSKDRNNYYNFVMSGKFEANGNIQSLLNYSDNCTDFCYYYMFHNCTSLTKAPTLPATGMAEGCYQRMFEECKSLSTAPLLPATTLAKDCYQGMFLNCTSLTTAPSLPATTLAKRCYQNMFNRCFSLVNSPTLPATTLAAGCYNNMFHSCSSLIVAPILPATTLVFGCYEYMFDGCTNLSSINVAFTNWDVRYTTEGWVKDVASTGIFYKSEELSEEYDKSKIPSGWTVINKDNE